MNPFLGIFSKRRGDVGCWGMATPSPNTPRPDLLRRYIFSFIHRGESDIVGLCFDHPILESIPETGTGLSVQDGRARTHLGGVLQYPIGRPD